MSIRNLTARLQEENVELRRRNQFSQSRSRPIAPQQNSFVDSQPQRQATFMSASGRKNTSAEPAREVMPVFQTPVRQVGLRAAPSEEGWHIPGGIAAKFGRNALQEPRSNNNQPKREAPVVISEKPQAASQIETKNIPDEPRREKQPERTAQPEEAARITIELQSH
jgi:hypothetical protein